MYNETKAVDEIEVMRGESWGDGIRIIQSYGKPVLRDQAGISSESCVFSEIFLRTPARCPTRRSYRV